MKKKSWFDYVLFWPVVGTLAGVTINGLFWAHDVSSAVAKVPIIEEIQVKQEKKITRIDYNIQLIGRKVGVPILEPAANE
jgi:hypothetical protein